MIIYGVGEKRTQARNHRNPRCPNCGENRIAFYFFRKYFHLFWIPVFPIGGRSATVCENCHIIYENDHVPVQLMDDYTYVRSTVRTPLYLFSGAILILFGIFAIYYFSDGMTTYKYPSGKKESKGKMIGDEPDGKWTYWYENGNLETVQYYKMGLEDSTFTWWDEEGNITKTGNFKDGAYQGIWKYFYTNGQLMAEENYDNNRLSGKSTYWYKSGAKSSEGNYVRDKQSGIWTYWYENGQIKESGNFDDNNRIGEWKSFFEDGKLNMVTVYQDSIVYIMELYDTNGQHLVQNGSGDYTSYFESGIVQSKGKIQNGKFTGVWKFWHEDGTLSEIGKYTDNEYLLMDKWDISGRHYIDAGTGYEVIRYENDTIASEGAYKNGYIEGEWIYRNEAGTVTAKVGYRHGKANGNAIYYFDSGKIMIEGSYAMGRQHGTWVWYHENGTKESRVDFIQDKKQGEQIFWNEAEKVIKKEYYDSGELIREEGA